MCCYLPVFLRLFEPFRTDLNESKAVYISEYFLVCRFVIMTLRLRLKLLLSSLTITSRRGERFSGCITAAKKTLFSFSPPMGVLHVNRNLRRNQSVIITIILGNVNRLRFIQIPSKRLEKTQEHRYITAHLFLLLGPLKFLLGLDPCLLY